MTTSKERSSTNVSLNRSKYNRSRKPRVNQRENSNATGTSNTPCKRTKTRSSNSKKAKGTDKRSRRTPVPCTSCGFCCTYVAYDINPPTTAKRAAEILWHLYHPGVVIYFDGEDWYGQFMTRCRQLGDNGKCRVYSHRPHICREHDQEQCEVNSDEPGQYFNDVNDFLAYLKQSRRRVYSALEKDFIPLEYRTSNGTPQSRQTPNPFQKLLKKVQSVRVAHSC